MLIYQRVIGHIIAPLPMTKITKVRPRAAPVPVDVVLFAEEFPDILADVTSCGAPVRNP